jgi:hypothetical protein
MNIVRPTLLLLGLLVAGKLYAGCEQLSVDTSQSVVRDSASGLTWSRCLVGQVGNGCVGAGSTLSWADALNQARSTELGGQDNWRMPKIEELKKLYSMGPACVAPAFPGIGSALSWSASANIDYATDAWAFDFAGGTVVVKARDSKLQVLLVANPK